MNWKKTALISFVILVVGAAVTLIIFTTEPEATRTGATKQTSMLVNVIEVERGNFTPTLIAMGTVEPSQDIILSPRVSGEIIERSQKFVPGEFVQKGDVLLNIDPSDYRNALQQRKSELQQAKADLQIEMGLQEAAQREYELYGDTLSEANRALVLRQPQLETVKAQVKSAEAAVAQAELDLQRTTIRAPFDAYILNRNINIGSQVAPGEILSRLVGTDTYWIEATVPVSKLRRLKFPQSNTDVGSEVRIRDRAAWPEGEFRTGNLFRKQGSLENETRLARVLITVDDPLGTNAENSNKPSLMIDSFVEVTIQARELTDVIRLNRDYLRSNETVWVMQDSVLNIRDVDIELMDAKYAYITSGLNDQDRVVTTNLATITEGVPLQLEAEENSSNQNNSE